MNAFLTYLWFLSGTVGTIVSVVLFVSFTIFAIYFLLASIECDGFGWVNGTSDDETYYDRNIKKYNSGYIFLRKYLKIWMVVFVLYSLIPSRHQMVVILSADKIVNAIRSENVQAIPGKIEKILDLSIKKLEK